ncbi:MAG: phage tail protein [Eubacterium sp.]|nr:phage tail protein [Eubacterium sp.]
MKLDIKYDSNLAEMKKVIENGGVKSMSRAINDALAKGKTQLGKNVCSVYAIKPHDFKSAAKVVKTYEGDLQKGKIEVQSRRLSSYHFPFTPKKYVSQKIETDDSGKKKKTKKRTVTITIKKGQKKSYPHGFIVNPDALSNGYTLLWERNGKKINPIRSVSVAQMVENEDVYNQTMDFMKKVYEETLQEHLKKQFKVEE